MHFLFITQHNPFAWISGGALASHAFLRAFSDLSEGSITVICADSVQQTPKDPNIHFTSIYYVPKRSLLSRFLSVFTGHLHRYTSFVKSHLKRCQTHYDIIVFDHNCIAGSLVKFCNSLGFRTITIHHNYEVEFYKDNHSGLARALWVPHVLRNERRAYNDSYLNLFLTKYDLETFSRVYGSSKGRNEVLGVFECQDIPKLPCSLANHYKEGRLVFAITGSLCTTQGVDGIKFFIQSLIDCLPIESEVIIAGRNPTDEVVSICSSYPQIHLIANPRDMSQVIGNSDIYICPTRLGGGIKLRIMDALRLGIPVISHSCSARGYDSMFNSPLCFRSFNDKKGFRDAVNEFISLARNGFLDRKSIQSYYIEVFSYNSGLNRLKRILLKDGLLPEN